MSAPATTRSTVATGVAVPEGSCGFWLSEHNPCAHHEHTFDGQYLRPSNRAIRRTLRQLRREMIEAIREWEDEHQEPWYS